MTNINNVENNKKKKSVIIIMIPVVIVVAIVFLVLIYRSGRVAHDRIIKDNLVTIGNGLYKDVITSGLYKDKPFSSKYYFHGNDVNNYLVFANSCWQIINIANNNAIKIIYLGKSGDNKCNNNFTESDIVWDSNQNNDWTSSSLRAYLNSAEYSFYNNPKIMEATWYVGEVEFSPHKGIRDAIKNEYNGIDDKEQISEDKVGLINVSDYLKATAGCTTGAYYSTEACGEDNYLYKGNDYWTINKTSGDGQHTWAIEKGRLDSKLADNNKISVNPVIYLKPGVLLKGKGTSLNPYIVIE